MSNTSTGPASHQCNYSHRYLSLWPFVFFLPLPPLSVCVCVCVVCVGMLGGYPQPSVQNLRLYSPPNMAILVTDTVMYQGMAGILEELACQFRSLAMEIKEGSPRHHISLIISRKCLHENSPNKLGVANNRDANYFQDFCRIKYHG